MYTVYLTGVLVWTCSLMPLARISLLKSNKPVRYWSCLFSIASSVLLIAFLGQICFFFNMSDFRCLFLKDTEFPGVVARPIGDFKSSTDFQYQLMKCNVNLLKLIQLGLTFYDEAGNKPPGPSTFQFNFKFNLKWGSVRHKCNLVNLWTNPPL